MKVTCLISTVFVIMLNIYCSTHAGKNWLLADAAERNYVHFRFVVEHSSDTARRYQLKETGKVYWLGSGILIDRSDIEYAEIETDRYGFITLIIVFNARGREKFDKITRDSVGSKMGIVINNELVMAPEIREHVTGGKVRVSGNFTKAELEKIAEKINN